MKYTLHHYRGRGAWLKHCTAQIIKHAQFNFLLGPFWVSFRVCMCVWGDGRWRDKVYRARVCVSASPLAQMWFPRMSECWEPWWFNMGWPNEPHLTQRRGPHIWPWSDRSKTPASLGDLCTPPPTPRHTQSLPPKETSRLSDSCGQNESIDLRLEHLTSQLKHLSLQGSECVCVCGGGLGTVLIMLSCDVCQRKVNMQQKTAPKWNMRVGCWCIYPCDPLLRSVCCMKRHCR